jgi:hypothetical protein
VADWRRCRTGDGYPHLAEQAAKVIMGTSGRPRVACQFCSWQRELPQAWHDVALMLQVWAAAHPSVGPVICPACAKPSTYLLSSAY